MSNVIKTQDLVPTKLNKFTVFALNYTSIFYIEIITQ